ncbi:MAG: YmdB family metallophosphoesterase [Candidatus Stahlbacteria bacterium]|nr:YmdB family metallophosphoesterase [Candidatus Stahlbacteria bacterium]
MEVLFIGVIVGKSGKSVISRLLSEIRSKEAIDFVIANAECAGKEGAGLSPQDAQDLIDMGIDCLTSGELVWKDKDMVTFLESTPSTLLRPLNYPPGVPGLGSFIYGNIGIINLLGRSFLANIDCPFRVGLAEIERMRQSTNLIVIDFHAQTTAEKQAFAYYVNGKVSAVLGTHTRVQTADEHILSEGTGYITDIGLTGIHNAVGGMDKELYIEYFLKGIPISLKPATTGESKLDGIILSLDETTGKTISLRRFCLTSS